MAYNTTDIDYNFFGRYGWICPKCGQVLSPTQSFCVFCNNSNNVNVIYGSTSILCQDSKEDINKLKKENLEI